MAAPTHHKAILLVYGSQYLAMVLLSDGPLLLRVYVEITTNYILV